MKKTLLVLVMLFMFCLPSVVFAGNQLDPNRWEWIRSNDTSSIYVDKQTVRSIDSGNMLIEFWLCSHCPNGSKEHNFECYNYVHCYLDNLKNILIYSHIIVMDSSGNTIKSEEYRPLRYVSIVPQSDIEIIVNRIRSMPKKHMW